MEEAVGGALGVLEARSSGSGEILMGDDELLMSCLGEILLTCMV